MVHLSSGLVRLKNAALRFVVAFTLIGPSVSIPFANAEIPAVLNEKKVTAVSVEGLKRIEKDAIFEKIQTQVGEKVQPDKIANDIRALYSMGYFDEIQVLGEPQGAGARIVFRLKERPVISSLVFEGNEQIDTEDLKEVIKLREWAILDINLVRKDIERIQEHYEEKGFYLAKVTFEVEKVKDDEVTLKFKINDFDKVEIKKITFLNNKVFSDDELKKVFQETVEGGLFSFLSGSGSFKESAFKNDLQRLTYWYLDHGYVKFRYENPIVTVSDDKRWLFITIYVEEGDPYTMGEIDFDGDLLYTKEELHSDLTLVNGDTFRISKRNQDIQKMTERYQDLGYAFVNVIPKMNINEDDKTVDITYNFEKGNLVYFGEIRIVGNAKTHDKVIRRELRIHEGELYNGTNLRVSRERVERLGYFELGQVIFNTITREDTDDLVDIEISVKERSTGTITLGAGYGSVQKFFFTTQISEINLLGRGQTISFQAQYAADARSRSLNIGFTDPYAFDTRWSLGGDLFFINFPIPGRYLMRKLGGDIRLGHPITDDINAFITYKYEGLRKVGPSENNDRVDASLDEGLLSSTVFSVVRDLRNNRFETTDGSYQSVSVETAGLGGDKKFVKLVLNNRIYFRVVGDLVFRNSTEYGHLTRVGGNDVPHAERFYLGGPNNMKGFEIFSLGPKKVHSNGFVEPLGGLVSMYSLFELEYPLIREAAVKWVLFYDAGNAFSHFPGTSDEPFTIRQDWGMGIRWFSPIGPLRFEWGFPFKPKAGEASPAFHFFIGPPF